VKLSVITVNLNDRAGLQQTLESVRSQTFRDYEHLVLDGGSTDGSAELLNQWASRLAYCRSEPDLGIFDAMNKGVSQAKGEYLLFLNSRDTLSTADTLQRLFAFGPTADVVYGNSRAVRNGVGGILTYPSPLTIEFLFVSSIGHQSALIRRELQLAHPYDTTLRIAADWKFFLQCFLEGSRFVHVDQVIAQFDVTGISNRAEYHALQRQERDAVLLDLLGKAEYRHIAAQVALGFLPSFLRPILKKRRTLLYATYGLGRRIRRVQTRWQLLARP
jgi:glycosyltransferase involved in cell wall biosynthesis